MKKITAVLVVLCMVIGIMPVISFAETDTVTAIRLAYFNSKGDEWKYTDGDNVLVSAGASGWEGAKSFTDLDGTTVEQSSLSGTGFGSARHSLIAFEIPEGIDTDTIASVTLSMTVKNVKQTSSGARLSVYGNSVDGIWSTSDATSTFGTFASLPLLGLTDAIKAGNSQGEAQSDEVITLSSLALTEYFKETVNDGMAEVTFRLAAPLGGIRIYDTNTQTPPTLTIKMGDVAEVKVKTVYYDGENKVDEEYTSIGGQIAGDTYTYSATPKATVVKAEDVYKYSPERSVLSVTVATDGSSEIVLYYEKQEDVRSFYGYEFEDEGAWCWFGDPRAVTFTNDEGTIDVTVIGYIDVHGSIKAMQINNLTGKAQEVLIRTNIQPDDHNNPTFVMIPDGRIVVFYSRHTDEACFWYRVSKEPGDITTFGEEKCLETSANTTYPSPFVMSDDPEHIYLCWRGIEWHPTIAKLTLPDENGDMEFDFGPYQIVRSTNTGDNVRPYAKYASNGKDKIYMSYTSTHPDNVSDNWLYFNQIDINTMTVHNIEGTLMRTIANGPLIVDHSSQSHIVDRTGSVRNWLWQVAVAEDGTPVIANVRIDSSKNNHKYYYVKWNGTEWVKTFLTDAGGKFHPSNTERCYSGGMSIDTDNPNVMYCSKPVEGLFGKVWEIFKYTMSADGTEIVSVEQITENSMKNNVRPWVIPNSEGDDLRVMWMNGDYDFWMVNSQYPAGYPTRIMGEVELPKEKVNLSDAVVVEDYDDIGGAFISTRMTANKVYENEIDGAFTVSADIYLDGDYEGDILDMGNVKLSVKNLPTRYADNETAGRARVVVTVGGKEYATTNVYGTSDDWKNHDVRTGGEYFFTKYDRYVNHTIVYDGEYLTLYRDGLIDLKEKIELDGIEKVNAGGFEGYVEKVSVYDRALNRDEIKALSDTEYTVIKPDVEATDVVTINYLSYAGEYASIDECETIKEADTANIYPGTDVYNFEAEQSFVLGGKIYTLMKSGYSDYTHTAYGIYKTNRTTGANLVPDGDFTDDDGNFSWGTWQTPRTDGGYNNGYYKDICEDWFYKVNRDTNASALYESGNITAENYALGTRWNDGSTGTCSLANFIPVEKGKTYYVAYDYKHVTGGVDASYISTAFVTTKAFNQNASGNNIPQNVTTEWQTNEFVITAEEDGYIYFHFSWLGNSNNAGKGPYWYFDNFKVCELKTEAIKASIKLVTVDQTTVELENLYDEDIENLKVYAASYNTDDEVIGAQVKTVTVEGKTNEDVTFDLSGDVRVYIWDENMDPVCDVMEESSVVTMEVTSVTNPVGGTITKYHLIGKVNGEVVNVITEDIETGKQLKQLVNREDKTVIICYSHISSSYITNIEIVEISE